MVEIKARGVFIGKLYKPRVFEIAQNYAKERKIRLEQPREAS